MAAMLHDFLYWDQSCTREQADLLLYEAMSENGVSAWRKSLVYWALYIRGEKAWNDNAAERSQGKPRIIPPKYLPIPPNTRWPDYRDYLSKEGVPVDSHNPSDPRPAYCTLELPAAGDKSSEPPPSRP